MYKYPFGPCERSALNQDPLPSLNKWPRAAAAALSHPLDVYDFSRSNGFWCPPDPNNIEHARRCEDRQPIMGIETAKHITREEWCVNLFRSVRPAPPTPERRRVNSKTL